MNIEDLEEIDEKKMYKTYDDWPNIAKQGLESNPKISIDKSIGFITNENNLGNIQINEIIKLFYLDENYEPQNINLDF